MKVKEFLKELKEHIRNNPKILEYDVYSEQMGEFDKEVKRYGLKKPLGNLPVGFQKDWGYVLYDSNEEYFSIAGPCFEDNEKKIFFISTNF